jgi:hypothetical protein
MLTILPAANRRIEIRIANVHRYGCKAAGSPTNAKADCPLAANCRRHTGYCQLNMQGASNENYRRLV